MGLLKKLLCIRIEQDTVIVDLEDETSNKGVHWDHGDIENTSSKSHTSAEIVASSSCSTEKNTSELMTEDPETKLSLCQKIGFIFKPKQRQRLTQLTMTKLHREREESLLKTATEFVDALLEDVMVRAYQN